ncbi:hypothetical protein FS842_002756 [Serendipita sp. 407]|nr:hypothetical protein FRC18_004474 [Serendipita sp. 400]KAG9040989.1 hypothetical protein FS842_002756 [Serendipita sp. 407]
MQSEKHFGRRRRNWKLETGMCTQMEKVGRSVEVRESQVVVGEPRASRIETGGWGEAKPRTGKGKASDKDPIRHAMPCHAMQARTGGSCARRKYIVESKDATDQETFVLRGCEMKQPCENEMKKKKIKRRAWKLSLKSSQKWVRVGRIQNS